MGKIDELAADAGTLRFAKLAEGALQLRGKIHTVLAVPALMGLVECGAIQRGYQFAAGLIAAVGLAPGQLLAERRYPSIESAEETSPEIRLLKHQPQQFLRLTSVLHLLLHAGDHGFFESGQRIAALRSARKSLCDALAAVLYAIGKQVFLGLEVAKKRAAGDSRSSADLFDSGAVEAYPGKQFPRSLFDLPQDKLTFPFAKRTGILRFRPALAGGRKINFLHCMQIMAQSAVL
jgi:hypothetical protein